MDQAAMEQYLRDTLPPFVEHIPSLKEALGDASRATDLLEKVRRDFVVWKGLKISLDIYESSPTDPVLIFHGGIGNYSRFYYLFLSLLAEKGFNVIAVDRPGHGFSEGARGDCTVEDVRDFMPLVIDKATELFNDRIGMFGSSLGGITTFYLLPDLKGVRSAICHNWLYPGESADKSKWLLKLILRAMSRFTPNKPIPLRKLVDEKKVKELSDSPYVVNHFMHIDQDPLYCQSLSLRSVVSYFNDYRPNGSYESVNIPVLGLISEYERVLPLQTSKAWWRKAGFSERNLRVIPKAKHMIFHDRAAEVLPIVADWFSKTLT